MMKINKKVSDVSQVFDQQWNVNHNYQETKQIIENRKQHFNKMYNIQDKEERKKEILKANSVDGRVKRLEENMKAANGANLLGKMNDFKNHLR